MTNPIAFVLAGVIALAIMADLSLNSGSALLFLAQKGLELLQLVMFWR